VNQNARAVFVVCLIILLTPALAGAAAWDSPQDEPRANPSALWQKALDVFRKNSDWIPGKMSIRSEILDRKGRPDSVTRLDFRILVDDQGNARTELLQAFKNGKDVSAEMKKSIEVREAKEAKAADKKDRFSISMSDIPFNPDKQQNVTVRDHAEKQLMFGRTCQRFDFSFETAITRTKKKESLTWIGKAWLDENSGIPVKLEFSIEPLPKNVYRFWTIYIYEISTEQDWTLKEVKVEGQGGFLFIKKSFRSTTIFSDYRRRPQKGVEK
jgi:hypothetical protein